MKNFRLILLQFGLLFFLFIGCESNENRGTEVERKSDPKLASLIYARASLIGDKVHKYLSSKSKAEREEMIRAITEDLEVPENFFQNANVTEAELKNLQNDINALNNKVNISSMSEAEVESFLDTNLSIFKATLDNGTYYFDEADGDDECGFCNRMSPEDMIKKCKGCHETGNPFGGDTSDNPNSTSPSDRCNHSYSCEWCGKHFSKHDIDEMIYQEQLTPCDIYEEKLENLRYSFAGELIIAATAAACSGGYTIPVACITGTMAYVNYSGAVESLAIDYPNCAVKNPIYDWDSFIKRVNAYQHEHNRVDPLITP